MSNETDRELLELAARSAGVDLDYRHGSNAYYYDDPETGREEWKPLHDDGQALRLVVQLDMGVVIDKATKRAAANVGTGDYLWEPFGDDQFAATRRAIVRAAAEIGR